tara:strand:- start:3592 stop:5064 length:1473 start_codon:yes stop_codon:yes gene_type:complete
MSYRNPKQYIDTQSMQIQQNLQRTLSNVGSQVMSNINRIHEENAKKVEAIRANADARVEEAQNSIIQAQSKNPTADFGDLNKELKLMNQLLLKDPTKRTAKEKSFITSMQSIGDTMSNMLKNTAMAQESMIEQANKIPGTPGAIDPKENPEMYAKLSVLANRSAGRTVARYKTNENGQVVFSLDVYEKTKDGEKFVGNVINDNIATTQMPPIIPNITKQMTEAINITMNTNDFVSKFGKYREADGAMVGEDGKTKGYRVTEEYFKTQLEKNASTILTGLTDREIVRLYNNTLDKGTKSDFDYNKPLTKKDKDLAQEALINSLMRQTKNSYNIFAKVTKEQKPFTEIKELTVNEKIKQRNINNKTEMFNKAVGQDLSNPSIISVPSFDGKLVATLRTMYDKSDPPKAIGRGWILERINGNKLETISIDAKDDIAKLSVQLGYGKMPGSKDNKNEGEKDGKNEDKKDGNYVFNSMTGLPEPVGTGTVLRNDG